jgi:hypothetical protein
MQHVHPGKAGANDDSVENRAHFDGALRSSFGIGIHVCAVFLGSLSA